MATGYIQNIRKSLSLQRGEGSGIEDSISSPVAVGLVAVNGCWRRGLSFLQGHVPW